MTSVAALEQMLLSRGIEKLAISSPVYSLRDQPTRPTEKGMWQVSVKENTFQVEWRRGRWRPTLQEALESCLGELEPTGPKTRSPTDLTDIL